MLLPYEMVVDVKTTLVACYNSCWQVLLPSGRWNSHMLQQLLAGVICQVADGIATIRWMWMVDGMTIGRWNSQGSVLI